MTSNRTVGELFHRRAAHVLSMATGLAFEIEVSISVGNPPKSHHFDLATADRRYVGEVKAYTWTVSGNAPSAKISTLREAVQYLEQLPSNSGRFIIMLRSVHPRTGESLAEYFNRLNPQLLRSVSLLELGDDDRVRVVCGSLPG